jgi:hypothetical protein
MTDVTVTFGGWGYDAWGTHVWGESDTPALPVGTGAVGTVGVVGNAVVNVTGVSGTTGLGVSSATGWGTSVWGLGAWGYGFNYADVGDQTIYISGVSAIGETGYTKWDETVYIGGWGRSTWGSGASWGIILYLKP